jgi:GNAT superfamily N-acetyltransferase
MNARPLLAELERIERAAWEDLARVAPASFAQAIGLEAAEIHHAFFLMASRIPVFQFNWLAGTGLNGDDGSSIAEAVSRFRAAEQSKFIIQIPPGPNANACERAAHDAGLRPHPLAWAKFHRGTSGAPVSNTALRVREVEAQERDLFAATAVCGFGMPPAMASWLSEIVGRPRWHVYVTDDGNVPMGAGALYVEDDFAWLGIGATRPEARRRGSQSALLARRLADAAKFGARHAVTETGVPQEGYAAPSYANILRAGFSVAYIRPNWAG